MLSELLIRKQCQMCICLPEFTAINPLSVSCKVSSVLCYEQMKEGFFTICVYTPDYRNSEAVWRVRQQLQDLGFKRELSEDTLQAQTMYYKPDIYTHLRAYDKANDFGATYLYSDSGDNWYQWGYGVMDIDFHK